jgi:uncharacterized membrane protein
MTTETRPSQTAVAAPPAGGRIESIDLIRGAVMVLMAIDHVRVYSGVPAGGPTPGVFLTRWITHFCAPAFIFLAGTSAYLSGSRRTPAAQSRLLVTRGAWLVVLELTVLRLAWTFNFGWARSDLAGVIWVIGWCMILMAALVRLPVKVIGGIGLAIVAGHNIIDPFLPQVRPAVQGSSIAWLLQILYFGGPIQVGSRGPVLMVLYSIIPWIGVMAAGYAFGTIVTKSERDRNRALLAIGLGATALFVVLRGFNLYGNPRPWGGAGAQGGPGMPALLDFLNTNKYPASFSFLLMTLGPTIALMPFLERARGVGARALAGFGRVPFFYYLLHIPLIHLLALIVSKIRLGQVSPWLFLDHPAFVSEPPPQGYTWSLALLYLVWFVALVLLYGACRWYDDAKRNRRSGWMRFL